MFTLVSVIQWSFRWKLLAAVLFVWAVIGGVSLIRNKEDQREYKAERVVVRATAMWLLVVVAVSPALIFPQFKLPKATGEYKVGTAVYTYTDNNRIETFNDKGDKRKVTVEFWYPKDAGG
ncbi:MAG: hypothetical protein ACM3TR_06250 [Caulobacteraceae bacterium]